MKIKPELLEEIEGLSRLQFSLDEIAASIGWKLETLEKSINKKGSKVNIAFERGRIKAEAEVRSAVLKMAKQGSTPAQKQMIDLITKNKESLKNIEISHSKSIKEKAEAELKLIDVKKARGELLDREKVTAAAVGIITNIKTRFLALPAKLAPLLIGIKNTKQAKILIEKEIYTILKELSQFEKIS